MAEDTSKDYDAYADIGNSNRNTIPKTLKDFLSQEVVDALVYGDLTNKITDFLSKNEVMTLLRGVTGEEEPKKDHGKHYKFSYKGIKIDPYRIFKIYKISDPAQQHAVKKLLRAGQSVKTLEQDIDEVILTLNRWKEMIKEDE